eukprot:Hpha_TRINITY_DN26832_c0_g1::TRINITY_DN26832_c0_g1_i1::g.17289::m.17289
MSSWEVQKEPDDFLSDWWDYVTLAAAGLCCASGILLVWCARRRQPPRTDFSFPQGQSPRGFAAPLLSPIPVANMKAPASKLEPAPLERGVQELEVWKDAKEGIGLDLDNDGLIQRVKADGPAMRVGGEQLIGRRVTHIEGEPVDGKDIDVLTAGKTSVKVRIAPAEPEVTFTGDEGICRSKSAPLLEGRDVDLTRLCEVVAIGHVSTLLRVHGIVTASDCSPGNLAAAGVRPLDRRILMAALGDPVSLAAASAQRSHYPREMTNL